MINGECDSRKICGDCRARVYNYLDDILTPDLGCIKIRVNRIK